MTRTSDELLEDIRLGLAEALTALAKVMEAIDESLERGAMPGPVALVLPALVEAVEALRDALEGAAGTSGRRRTAGGQVH